MKKLAWISIIVLWICSLILLIIALTDKTSQNIFKDYRFIIGIGFIVITGFIRKVYNKGKKQQQTV